MFARLTLEDAADTRSLHKEQVAKEVHDFSFVHGTNKSAGLKRLPGGSLLRGHLSPGAVHSYLVVYFCQLDHINPGIRGHSKVLMLQQLCSYNDKIFPHLLNQLMPCLHVKITHINVIKIFQNIGRSL